MAEFGSLWVGGPLKKLQEVCLASFVHYGHTMYLYVYDLDMKVPAGVIKRDAREILPESEIFLVQGTYASFADMFRYQMIHDHDLIWVDADTLCCSADWDFFKDGILFGGEYGQDGFVQGVLKFPPESLIAKYLVTKSRAYDKSKIKWAEIGPHLLTQAVYRFGLEGYAQSPKTLCMITIPEAKKFWTSNHSREIIQRTQDPEVKSASLYNGALTVFGNMNTDKIPNGSAMQYFYRKYVEKRIGL